MSVIIGSARSDESGKYSGGKPGDQKQGSKPDYKGEVSRQQFYIHKLGWLILRPKDRKHAKAIAKAMAQACDNPHMGYSQSGRYGVLKNGTASQVDTNCDCSLLVRVCVKEGTGKDPGDFTTANEASKLMATGLFDKLEYQKGITLHEGDILVTKTKGHTVIVIEGEPYKTIEQLVKEVKAGLWGTGIDRQNRLSAAGYDYAAIRAAINREASVQHVDKQGIELIKQFEKCKLKAYQLAGEQYYTIGYGHYGADVLPNMTISQERADELLKIDLQKFENYVKKYVTEIVLTQPRMNALTSYTYNRGPKGIQQLSQNCHSVQEYADGIVKYWGTAERYKDALIKRRKKEREVFLGK